MGNKSKYSKSAEKQAEWFGTFDSIVSRFNKIVNGSKSNHDAFVSKVNSSGLCFDDVGERGSLECDNENFMPGKFVVIDPHYLSGEVPEDKADFYAIRITPENKSVPEFAKITFDKVLEHFDPAIKNTADKAEREFRKNVVLWNTLGFESLKDKVFDAVKMKGVERPRRGFFGTIRDWFGKDNEGRKEYERAKEVYYAQKSDYIKKTYGINGISCDKSLLDESSARYYIKNNVNRAALETAGTANRTLDYFATLRYEKKLHQSDGAKFIQGIFDSERFQNPKTELEKKVKEANDTVKDWLVKYGKDIRDKNMSTELSEKFIEKFSSFCVDAKLLQKHSSRDTNQKDDTQRYLKYCSMVKKLSVSMEKLDSFVNEAGVSVPDDKPQIPTEDKMMTRLATEILDACVPFFDKEKSGPAGAEAIKNYLSADPMHLTPEGKQFAKHIGNLKLQMNGNEVPGNVAKFCEKMCKLVSANMTLLGDEDNAAGKAVESVADTYFKDDKTAKKFIDTELSKQKDGISLNIPQ